MLTKSQWEELEDFGWDAGRLIQPGLFDSRGRTLVTVGMAFDLAMLQALYEEGCDFNEEDQRDAPPSCWLSAILRNKPTLLPSFCSNVVSTSISKTVKASRP